MTTNLDVLDQYALSLQGTASKILELGLDPRGFPSAEVAAGALGPRVHRASVQMEAMGLWRPSLDPVMIPENLVMYGQPLLGLTLMFVCGFVDVLYFWTCHNVS